MVIKTNITEMFGIKHPIVSAPMGPYITKQITVAVSEAGGLGTLSEAGYAGAIPWDIMKESMEYVVERTDKPFGFNIRTARVEKQWYEKMIVDIPEFIMSNTKLKEQCTYALTSAGTSRALPSSKSFQKLKETSQIKHFHVGSAFWLCEKCVKKDPVVDGLVVTGIEGGGHQAYEQVAGNILLAQVQQAFPDVPKITCGFGATGTALAGALTMGAGALAMGTRFIGSKESDFHENYQQVAVKAMAKDTQLVMGEIANIRLFKNKYTEAHGGVVSKEEKMNYESSRSTEQHAEDLKNYDLVLEGNVEDTAVLLGQTAGVIHSIESISDIIEKIMKEAEESLRNASKLVQ